MVENDESINAAESVLFHWKYNNYEKDTISSNPSTLQNLSISLGNIKILKISRSNQKSGTPRMLIITVVFEEKAMSRLQKKNQALQECLYLLSFLNDFVDNNGWRKMSYFQNVNISKDVWQKWATHGSEQGWRSTLFWVSWGPQQHPEKCRIENVNRTADVWQKWRSSARGKTGGPPLICKIQS